MKNMSKQRIYASLLALGASFLLYRTIMMISQGSLVTLVWWVSALLLAELIIDASCLASSIYWWIKNDSSFDRIPLRLGTAVVFLHSVRVLIFVLGRAGPFLYFDVRPEYRLLHEETWSWFGVYLASIMTILGITGVIIIWRIRRRRRSKNLKAN
jgi:hypothetical protein